MADALGAAGISSGKGPFAHDPVHRAEAAGLIIFDHVRSNLTRVFANEADRAQYYADREEEELSEVRTLADVVAALPGRTRGRGAPVRWRAGTRPEQGDCRRSGPREVRPEYGRNGPRNPEEVSDSG
jgi:hypothetical protein